LTAHISVTPLVQGLSNQNYVIDTGTTQWVLRVNSNASSQICSRINEVANWKLAIDKGLAPRLDYVSPDRCFYLSEYIHQPPSMPWACLLSTVSAQGLDTDTGIWPGAEKLLLNTLQDIASLPLPINHMSVAEQWSDYRHQLLAVHKEAVSADSSSYRTHWLEQYRVLMALESNICDWLEQLGVCTELSQYSHRDLNPHNLLFRDGKLICIDFEYACSSHPLFDLAGVLSSHALSTSQRRSLIEGYLDTHPILTRAAESALPAAIHIYWVFAACWALLMAAESITEPIQTTHLQPHNAQAYMDCFDQYFAMIN